ncbi:hypothetical protein REPUB_Repub19eG0040300 [Reevesia pubescens]
MAQKNHPMFVRVFLFIALLLISYGIRFSEEVRLLKIDQKDDYVRNHVMIMSSRKLISLNRGIDGADHDAQTAASAKSFTAFEYDMDDVHPTSPGHSPSVGHSTPPNGLH